ISGKKIRLIVSIEMHFVRAAADLFAFFELINNIRVAGSRNEGWEPVQAREDTVLYLAGGNVARPADYCRYAEAAFEGGAFSTCKRCLSAIGPRKVLGTVIRAEHKDRVVIEPIVLQVS